MVFYGSQLGLSTHDNTTPVRLIHNTAAHLQGSARTIGAVIIGCSGVRTFCPDPVSKLIECIGGVSALLGLVAMATNVEGLYASVKALSCVLRSNPSARIDMERTRGYQVRFAKKISYLWKSSFEKLYALVLKRLQHALTQGKRKFLEIIGVHVDWLSQNPTKIITMTNQKRASHV